MFTGSGVVAEGAEGQPEGTGKRAAEQVVEGVVGDDLRVAGVVELVVDEAGFEAVAG